MTLSSAEPGHRLFPRHPAAHICTDRVLKNIEGDVSCRRKSVAALMEAGGIGREERAVPQTEKGPNTWTERKGEHKHGFPTLYLFLQSSFFPPPPPRHLGSQD